MTSLCGSTEWDRFGIQGSKLVYEARLRWEKYLADFFGQINGSSLLYMAVVVGVVLELALEDHQFVLTLLFHFFGIETCWLG